MKTATLALGLALVVLTGCEFAKGAVDDATRSQARKAVNASLGQKLPGVDLSPLTDCVINNASSKEILTLAGMAVRGVDQETANLILQISTRPETVQCIAKAELPIF